MAGNGHVRPNDQVLEPKGRWAGQWGSPGCDGDMDLLGVMADDLLVSESQWVFDVQAF